MPQRKHHEFTINVKVTDGEDFKAVHVRVEGNKDGLLVPTCIETIISHLINERDRHEGKKLTK